MPEEKKPRLAVKTADDVTIAYFLDSKVLDELNIKEVGDELLGIARDKPKIKLVVNFERVDYLSSAVLGKLMALHKTVVGQKGKLRLCCIKPSIYEVFEITKLNKVFDIKDSQDEAVEGI